MLTQRTQGELDDVEPVVEVLAEAPSATSLQRRLVATIKRARTG